MALDINPDAVKNTRDNAQRNGYLFPVKESDLFAAVKGQKFSRILVNPPYYPKEPKNLEEHAWYCGPSFEYFQRFFAQAGAHLEREGWIWMILSEDCDLEAILEIGEKAGFLFERVHEIRRAMEWNYIYMISKSAAN